LSGLTQFDLHFRSHCSLRRFAEAQLIPGTLASFYGVGGIFTISNNQDEVTKIKGARSPIRKRSPRFVGERPPGIQN